MNQRPLLIVQPIVMKEVLYPCREKSFQWLPWLRHNGVGREMSILTIFIYIFSQHFCKI